MREDSGHGSCPLQILSFFAAAQTIVVDVSRSTNHFVPIETLGAGVDRIPVAAIDRDLLPPSLQETLSAGWQPAVFSAEYGTRGRGLALESERALERAGR